MKHKSRFFQLFGTDNVAYVCVLLFSVILGASFYGFYANRSESVVEQIKPVKIGYIGDSITHGTGNFRTAVETEVSVLGSNYEAINHGVGGTTSKDWQPGHAIYDSAMADLKARHVQVASIMLGTNDARDDIATSPQAYRKNIATLINNLLSSGIVQQVIINYPPYAAPGSGKLWGVHSPDRLIAYMRQLDTLVDGKRILKGDTESYDYFEAHQDELVDGVHPNREGYDRLGKLWARAYIAAQSKRSIGFVSTIAPVRRSL